MWGHIHYVWAIHEDKIHNYIVPRECPRICLAQKEAFQFGQLWTDQDDYLNKAFLFIPIKWKHQVSKCKLYKYQFNPQNFEVIDPIAGYYVSKKFEIPTSLQKITDCLQVLAALQIGVKFLDDHELNSLKESVVNSTDEFSIIKWDNFENYN